MTLLAPLFLLGVLAVGLPIWLHRLSSENPNKQAFSSLMFLEPGEPRRVLAKNLQYLLLLALRIGFLVLLALAFAGPAVWRTPAAGGGDGATLSLVVLDASASMAHRDRWSDAQEAARDVIAGLGAEDIGQVVAVGRTAELLTQQTRDTAVLRAAVANAEPGVFRLDFGGLVDALDGIVRAAELPVEIHIVTDAQRTGLPSRFADLAPAGNAALRIHNVGAAGPSDNWAIESLGGSAITGALQATVTSFAASPATKGVVLELDGEVVERKEIALAPGETARVEFAPLALRAGSNRVAARFATSDDFAVDDLRFIALQRPEPRPVLLIAGSLRGRETLFFTAALETLGALAIEPETTTIDGLEDLTLGDFHFVVVAEAGVLRPSDMAAFEDYVESGGAVLLALGPGSTGLTEVPLTRQPLAPVALSTRDLATGIGVIETSHPALRGLEALRGGRFRRYAGLQAAPGDTVLLGLETGAPLLLERELGAGRVLVYGSTLDREWNDLAVQPVYVPFVSGLANHMLGNAGFTSEAALGSTLALRAMGLAGGQVFDTAGEVALGLGGTDDVLLDQIGFYEVVGGGVSQFLAVNFDTLESNLSVMDADAIGRWQRLGSEPGQGVTVTAAGEPELAPLGLWVLALLALLIVMESWAGNWHLRVQRGISA